MSTGDVGSFKDVDIKVEPSTEHQKESFGQRGSSVPADVLHDGDVDAVEMDGQLSGCSSRRSPDPSDPEGADVQPGADVTDSPPRAESSPASSALPTTTTGRRKLSKQAHTTDEDIIVNIAMDDVSNELAPVQDEDGQSQSPAHRQQSMLGGEPSPHHARSRLLVRGLALCEDDDTRLRPPPPVPLQRHMASNSLSVSKESSGTDYTDASGMDIRCFVTATLHKNARDRQMMLTLEKQLTDFVLDKSREVHKFATMSSYNRMLIHRAAVLFGLDHNVDTSGQSVVVNKTDRTSLPDFEFASLIQGNLFTDSKKFVRSQEEVVPAGCQLMGERSDWFFNNPQGRALSFETQQSDYNWTQRPARSFDVGFYSPHRSAQWDEGSQRTTTSLRKAGSFGGVPEYYRSSNEAYSRPSYPPFIQQCLHPSVPGAGGTVSGHLVFGSDQPGCDVTGDVTQRMVTLMQEPARPPMMGPSQQYVQAAPPVFDNNFVICPPNPNVDFHQQPTLYATSRHPAPYMMRFDSHPVAQQQSTYGASPVYRPSCPPPLPTEPLLNDSSARQPPHVQLQPSPYTGQPHQWRLPSGPYQGSQYVVTYVDNDGYMIPGSSPVDQAHPRMASAQPPSTVPLSAVNADHHLAASMHLSHPHHMTPPATHSPSFTYSHITAPSAQQHHRGPMPPVSLSFQHPPALVAIHSSSMPSEAAQVPLGPHSLSHNSMDAGYGSMSHQDSMRE